MGDTPIKIEFDHRVEEHVAACRLYYAKRSKWASADRIVAFGLIVIGTTWVTLAGIHWWTLIWFVLAVLEFFNLLSVDPVLVRWQFKSTPKFNERNTIVFEEAGIHFRTPTIEARLKWDFYSEMLENDKVFLLVYGKRMYSVIPKRAFRDENEQNSFRQLVEQRLKPASV